ncbi:hypothetical protein P0E82_14290, partial [Enterococcus faecalis]|uniref:hypothetical protein n=1 Tax=Enterococcus faecalis TaxID=1351 RepID=UPI0025B07B5E
YGSSKFSDGGCEVTEATPSIFRVLVSLKSARDRGIEGTDECSVHRIEFQLQVQNPVEKVMVLLFVVSRHAKSPFHETTDARVSGR